MSQTLSLYRLQQVDNQIDRVQTRLGIIQNNLKDDSELMHAITLVEKTDTGRDTADQILKQAESSAHLQRLKIEQTEASLYGGMGHTPKELLDLQNDVGALKRHLITLEDAQLEAMINLDYSISENQAAKTSLEFAQKHAEEQNKHLLVEQTALQKELEKLISERSATADPIPTDIIGLYEKLRQQRRGISSLSNK